MNSRSEQEAAIERYDLVSDAIHNLRSLFKDMACAEALTRALVSERLDDRDMALFWVEVYDGLTQRAASSKS